MGKIRKIIHDGTCSEDDLEFLYDAMGNRLVKIVMIRSNGQLLDEKLL